MHAYEHTQPGTLTRIVLGLVVFASGSVAIVDRSPDSAVVFVSVALVTVVVLAAFHALTIRVSYNEIQIIFGMGLPRKTFLIQDIVSTSIVRNHWYHGWGIRYFGGGWLYNVSGFDAVELELANGRKARLGTDEPQELRTAIEVATKQLKHSEL